MTDEQLMAEITRVTAELERLHAIRRGRLVAAYKANQSMRDIAAHWRVSQPAVQYALQKAAGHKNTTELRE